MSWNKHLTKLCRKCPLHLKYVRALPWEIWSDRFSHQCSTYIYILMNHWIATNMTGSHCLKNRSMCSKLHHRYTTCSKCSPPARTNIWDDDKLKWRIKNEWRFWVTSFIIERAVGVVAPFQTKMRLCLKQTFWSYDVKMIWLTACSTETITASRFVSVDSWKCPCTCKYCIDSLICHFKFPKGVLAHILSEVGIFA